MRTNESLKSAKVYYENGVPYIKLVYTYDDKDGGHEVTIPKVEFPFPTQNLPSINYYDGVTIDTLSDAEIFYKDGICYADKLIKPVVHEMTLEEIEKSLGYPVKIVSKRKENKNA